MFGNSADNLHVALLSLTLSNPMAARGGLTSRVHVLAFADSTTLLILLQPAHRLIGAIRTAVRP
jgi:hypothetical protein